MAQEKKYMIAVATLHNGVPDADCVPCTGTVRVAEEINARRPFGQKIKASEVFEGAVFRSIDSEGWSLVYKVCHFPENTVFSGAGPGNPGEATGEA